jgi:hypothetical protein
MSKEVPMSVRSLVLAAALLSVPAVASAQGATNEPPPHPHVGLFGGFGLHAGNLQCSGENCNEFRKAGGFDARIGWGISEKLGVLFDLYLLTSKEDNLSITQTMATVGVRYWVVPILWLEGGVGAASASYRYDGPLGIQLEGHTDNVAAVQGAVGLELIKSKRFALDVELRGGYGFYGDEDNNDEPDNTGRSTSLGVGFTWF